MMFEDILAHFKFKNLPEGWHIDELDNLCNGIFDCPHSTPKLSDQGPYIARTPDIRRGFFDTDKAVRVSEKTYLDRIKRAEPSYGDLLFSREGTYFGDAAEVPAGTKVCLGQRMVLIRPDNNIIRSSYLRMWINSSIFQKILLGLRDGTVAERLNLSVIRKLPVLVPPIDYQEGIENKVIPIENKVLLNRQTNQTLEHIAQALFKSWFVDFEPTRAKIEAMQAGQDPEQAAMAAISGKTVAELDQLDAAQLAQLKTTAALFPNGVVESELGEVPEGWETREIKSLTSKISKGTTPRKADIQNAVDESSIRFLKVRDMSDDGEITRLDLDMIPESVHLKALKRSILEVNDLLFSIAGTIGRVSLVENDLANSNCNQAIAFVRLKDPKSHLEICRLNLRSHRIQSEVISKVVQGVQANFSLAGLGETKILLPNDALLSAFNNSIAGVVKKQRLLLHENRKLAELRDTLLPKLLSGELSTSKAEIA